jgi:hypothetical protein
MRTIVVLGGASLSAAALRALACELGDGSIIVGSVEDAPRKVGLEELLARLDYGREPVVCKAECELPYQRHSEAGQLRRDSVWREKQARAMFNARVKHERRKRKQMRGIGRR